MFPFSIGVVGASEIKGAGEFAKMCKGCVEGGDVNVDKADQKGEMRVPDAGIHAVGNVDVDGKHDAGMRVLL